MESNAWKVMLGRTKYKGKRRFYLISIVFRDNSIYQVIRYGVFIRFKLNIKKEELLDSFLKAASINGKIL